MPIYPVQTSFVVIALLTAAILSACDSKEKKELADQSVNGRQGVRKPMAVMPVLGIRG